MGNFGTRIAAAVLVASLVVLVPATAGAATQTSSFSISGTEVSATSTTGRFVGARRVVPLAPGTPRSSTSRSARPPTSDLVAPLGWPCTRRNRPTW
jgi:hypothetical protein